jgi:hypothetical protein
MLVGSSDPPTTTEEPAGWNENAIDRPITRFARRIERFGELNATRISIGPPRSGSSIPCARTNRGRSPRRRDCANPTRFWPERRNTFGSCPRSRRGRQYPAFRKYCRSNRYESGVRPVRALCPRLVVGTRQPRPLLAPFLGGVGRSWHSNGIRILCWRASSHTQTVAKPASGPQSVERTTRHFMRRAIS